MNERVIIENNIYDLRFEVSFLHHEQESTNELDAGIKVDETNSGGTNIVALALRSAFLTFVAAVLAFSCFLVFFPYPAMKIYSGLGNRELALNSAEKYLERHANQYDAEKNVLPTPFGKYADALYFAVNTSNSFMNEASRGGKLDSREAKHYAQKVYKYSQMYLSANTIESLYERTLKVDAYSLKNTPRSLHPYVYSYRDDLERASFKAAYILGNDEAVRDAFIPANTWNNADSQPWTVNNDGELVWGSGYNEKFSDEDVRQMFLLLSNITTYVRLETDRLYYSGKIVLSEKDAEKYERGSEVRFTDRSVTARLFGADAYKLLVDADGKNTPLYENICGKIELPSEPDKYIYGRLNSLLEYLKDNTQRYAFSELTSGDQSKHLKYTYYLKTLKDFAISMINMTAVLSSGRATFKEENQKTLQENHSIFDDFYFVHAYSYRDGLYGEHGDDMNDWYSRGPLINYIYFGMTREEISNKLKPHA